jgi:hypothetical protein
MSSQRSESEKEWLRGVQPYVAAIKRALCDLE